MAFITQSIDLFHKGGLVMYGLLFCSLLVVAVMAERFSYYRHVTLKLSAFQAKLQPLLEKQCIEEAEQVCKNLPAAIAMVAAEGLRAYRRGRNVERSLESTAALAAARLREHLNYLNVVVTLAPLMGLLGTIVGMINSFSVFKVQAGEPAAITGGVGEALIATATGLCVAMLALIAHTYLVHRLNGLITDIEQTMTFITDYLPVPAKERRETHGVA